MTYPQPNTKPPNTQRKTLTTAEFNEKRAKGLCYWCDEKYEAGHRCKGKRPQVYQLEVEVGGDIEEESEDEVDMEGTTECAHLSLHALDGVSFFHTMRVVGHYGKTPLHILLDSGSTHNFVGVTKAKKLGCKVEQITPMWVKVADGGQIRCDAVARGFTWKMQGIQFSADLILLPLSGSDIVLGIQWFTVLGPIL